MFDDVLLYFLLPLEMIIFTILLAEKKRHCIHILTFVSFSATNRLTPLINLVREKFPKVYHDDTTEEWINDKIENVLTRVVEIEKYLNNIKSTVLKL